MPVALYTKDGTNYGKLNIDYYGKHRNALNYQGNDVVICHPPCAHWGAMSQFASISPGEKYLALHALWLVEINGGILEHPAQSKIWNLIRNQPTHYTGQILSVNLSWFGFPTQKRTYLYIKGATLKEIPPHPISFESVTTFIRPKHQPGAKHLPKSQRDTTPISMCKWLIEITRIIEYNKKKFCVKPACNRLATG